jgi:3-dehydroquinate synthase
MSVSFKIQSSTGGYTVDIENGLFQKILEAEKSSVVIADEWFLPMLTRAGVSAIAVSASETSKSLDAIPDLIVKLRQANANRQTKLLALGGGIVQDIVAFTASIYMRGVEWAYLPTTVLAMTDSCIGGKSSINVGPYKNIVGTFHPPSSIWVDPKLALTLTDEQRIGGLIEAAKICYCRSFATFEEYLGSAAAASMPEEQLEQIIITSLRAKKWFIEVDEFDRKERLILNFGHTFGHAIEGASHFQIAHGIGVAIGILCAVELGSHLGRSYESASNLQSLTGHLRSLLSSVPGLAGELTALSPEDILDRFRADKKHGAASYNVILVAQSGEVELVKLPKDDKSELGIKGAISRTIRTLC